MRDPTSIGGQLLLKDGSFGMIQIRMEVRIHSVFNIFNLADFKSFINIPEWNAIRQGSEGVSIVLSMAFNTHTAKVP